MLSKGVINEVADLVRSSFDLSCPYDPEETVRKLKGTIEETIEDMAIDASIRKNGVDSFIIQLNRYKPALRERFSIAHELGHLFLHMGFLIDKDLWATIPDGEFTDSVYYRMSGNYTQEESEANEFAAAFLMPRAEFRDQIYSNSPGSIIDIHSIASHFGVSSSAVLTRARWLGYVRW